MLHPDMSRAKFIGGEDYARALVSLARNRHITEMN